MDLINKIVNQMEIIVKSKEELKNQIIVKSKQIICPMCHEPCKIRFENNRISLYDCIYNHNLQDINLKDFHRTQEINLSKIICNVYQERNKGNSNNNEFFKCLTCKYNLCNLCKSSHDPRHIVVEYALKNSICGKHNDKFTNFCFSCKLNLCISCESEHRKHETIYFGDILQNTDELKSLLLNIKNDKDLFKNQLKEVIKKLTEFSENMDIYYEIKNDVMNNYDIRNKDFYMLHDLYEVNSNNFLYGKLKELQNINKEILDVIDDEGESNEENETETESDELNNNFPPNHLNEMTMQYYIDRNDKKVKIFGYSFVKENDKKCFLLVGGEKKSLTEYLILRENRQVKRFIDVKLIENEKITSMKSMFHGCHDLKSLKDISKWDTKNITNMSGIFDRCRYLEFLPDISKWNTDKVTDMSYMFSGCELLEFLPDISKWNTKNVTNMKICLKIVTH